MTITIVAAVARNGVIGIDGGLPWHLPDDLRRFKELTLGHVLVMGRKTYESIGHSLPGRATIVVTRNPSWDPGSAEVRVAGSVSEAIEAAASLEREVFVVGGGEVYAEALALADRLELTWVDAEPDGDTRFPEVDWDEWRELRREHAEEVAYASYERVQPPVGPGGR